MPATIKNHQPAKRLYRFTLLVGITLVLVILAGCTNTTGIAYTNQTVCGTILIELTNSQTGITETYHVPMGETITIEVTPNINYAYVVDYTTANSDTGMQCMAIHRGQLNVEPGTTQTFNLTAVTPTPIATP